MKIKILLVIAIIATLTIHSGFAQQTDHSFYIKIYAGYSLFSPGGDQLLVSNGFLYAPEGQFLTLNSSTRSGEGLNVGLGIQKGVGKVVLLGIDVNYLAGKKFKAAGAYGDGYTAPYSYTATGTQSFWSVIPGITFKVFQKTNYNLYTRLGLIFAFDIHYHDNEAFPSSDKATFQTNFYEVDDYKYGLNMGIEAAIGVQFKLTGNLKGFAEINNRFLDASPNSMKNQNTVTQGGNTNVYNQEFIYNKSNKGFVSSSNNNIHEPSFVQHFNSTMLNIGVAFTIR